MRESLNAWGARAWISLLHLLHHKSESNDKEFEATKGQLKRAEEFRFENGREEQCNNVTGKFEEFCEEMQTAFGRKVGRQKTAAFQI